MRKLYRHIAILCLYFLAGCNFVDQQSAANNNRIVLNLSYTDSVGKEHPARIEFPVSPEEFAYLQKGANYNASMLITDASADSAHKTFDDQIGRNSDTSILPNRKQSDRRYKYNLGPEGIVMTEVKGDAKNIAYVSIYSGSVQLYTVTLTQVQPTATLDSDLIMGGFVIRKGAKLKMQIPTELQDGYVFMACQFRSGDNDETEFGSIISTWTL